MYIFAVISPHSFYPGIGFVNKLVILSIDLIWFFIFVPAEIRIVRRRTLTKSFLLGFGYFFFFLYSNTHVRNYDIDWWML